MKNLTIKGILVVSIILSGLLQNVQAQKLEKKYNLQSNSVFMLRSTKSNVKIENNDKKTLEILYSVESEDKEETEKIKKGIHFEFETKDSIISLLTKIDESVKQMKFKIYIDVKMPSSLHLNLKNMYGSVEIDKLTSTSTLVVKYGSFKANSLMFGNTKPRTLVALAYSSGIIENTDWVQLDVAYSRLEVKNSRAVVIKSKYSKLMFDQAETIVSDSKYDNSFEIDNVKNFAVIGKYSKYEIESLSGLLDADLKYSDIHIDNVSKSFSEITAKIKYGNAKIEISENASYTIDGEAHYGKVSTPGGAKINEDRDHTHTKVKGHYGEESKNHSKVNITVKFGNIDIEKT